MIFKDRKVGKFFVASISIIATTCAANFVVAADRSDEQLMPILSYREGAYASGSRPLWAGMIDYYRYVNEVEGGINGVKLNLWECETAYAVERGIECYERFKNGIDGSPVAIFSPNSYPLAEALIETTVRDKIPHFNLNYGRDAATNGSVFPYYFPVMLNAYNGVSAQINYIKSQLKAGETMADLKIAIVYLDGAYGRGVFAPLELMQEQNGFELIKIPVAHPGLDQRAQWQQIRRAKVDWVLFRTWGAMTPVAIKTAARTGFPTDRLIGDIWSGGESDVIPAGEAGIGYTAITTYPAGTDFRLIQEIKKNIVDKGLSDLRGPEDFGTVYYNSGVVQAVLMTEAIREGMKKFGNRPLSGEEGQWGLEHISVDQNRLEELGMVGLMQEISLSCSDHEGGGAARMLQWDGQKWLTISDWIAGDRELTRQVVDTEAAAFAADNGITPRDCP